MRGIAIDNDGLTIVPTGWVWDSEYGNCNKRSSVAGPEGGLPDSRIATWMVDEWMLQKTPYLAFVLQLLRLELADWR
jgi:hypothetical protein